MKEIKNCPICNGKAALKRENKERQFRKETFTIVEHFYKCAKCAEEFTTTEIDELNFNQVLNQYRASHNIPFIEEIAMGLHDYDLNIPSYPDAR